MSAIAERRLEEKERRRNEIIDAAERVFTDTGFEAARMDDVAKAARVSRALVYLYFKDKTELGIAICVRALRLLRDHFEATAAKQKTGYDKIEAIGRAYLEFARTYPCYFRALQMFEAHRPEEVAANSTEREALDAGAEVHMVTVRALQSGLRDGTIRKDIGDPFMVALTLWAFSHGTILLALTKTNVLADKGAQAPKFIDHALGMAMRSVAAEGH